MKLRSYQKELVEQSTGSDNVLIQADTGAGKTAILAQITKNNRYVLCIAHRNILIKQLSRTLAIFHIKHDILAAKHTIRQCLLEHRSHGFGDSFICKSNRIVCSIDSLLSRYRHGVLDIDTCIRWLIIVDEAHHMIDKNKWGKLLKIFPNARIIGATATPCRLDQVSLSYKKGGVFHRLIQANELKLDSVKKLIDKGFLSDFKAYSITERIDHRALTLGMHDYTYKSLERETNKVVFEMAGDAVTHYKRLAMNKQALAFCVSIDIAKKTAEKFKQAGIASAAIHSKLGAAEASRIFNLFEMRHIKVLVNVDMIGEGVDIPAIEALIMLRKTASFGLYRQWIGRALRVEENKPHAILIDHTGNIRLHGMPDKHIEWSLENPPQAVKSNLFPCKNCFALINAWCDVCPECGADITRAVDGKMDSDIRYIDYALVEIKRRAIDMDLKKRAMEKNLRENLQLHNTRISGTGRLKKSIHKVKLWVSEILLEFGVPIYDLNIFFMKEDHDIFWVEKFTYMDLKKNNAGKAIRVYKSWLKSQ